jgi:small-conductance mechanosensitive channel
LLIYTFFVELINIILSNVDIIVDNPIPTELLSEFYNYAAVYELRAYTNKPNEFLKIQSDLRKNIFDILKKNEINMTVPDAQQTIDMRKNSEDTKDN